MLKTSIIVDFFGEHLFQGFHNWLENVLWFFVVIFPMDFLEHGIWGKNFAMLGLGDIVIPGMSICYHLESIRFMWVRLPYN